MFLFSKGGDRVKSKNSYLERKLAQKELLDELYNDCNARDEYNGEDCERCMYCSYHILPGEEALTVNSTGDLIHARCWIDYADDNVYELCESAGFN